MVRRLGRVYWALWRVVGCVLHPLDPERERVRASAARDLITRIACAVPRWTERHIDGTGVLLGRVQACAAQCRGGTEGGRIRRIEPEANQIIQQSDSEHRVDTLAAR